jgi:hypothetical protein
MEKPDLKKLSDFNAPYEKLGKIISKTTKEHRVNNKKPYGKSRNENEITMELFKSLFQEDTFEVNPFQSEEGKRLAIFLFGEVIGALVEKVWDKFNETPYQSGYYRRSFRMNKPNAYHLEKKLAWLQSLYWGRESSSYIYAMSMNEVIQYMGYAHVYDNLYAMLIAVYLESELEELEGFKECIWDIFLTEDEVGMVTSGLIRGVLLSHDKEAWEMVTKLLLSAQRQEGLRQSILEALDETSVGALEYMIGVILEHELYRFSSVVRAIDVWFGFGWEAPKKGTIKKILELAHFYFSHHDEIEKTMKKSRNNLEIYVALWVKAVAFDVSDANLLAIEMIQNDKTLEKKLLGFMFMAETERTDTSLVPWIYENFGKIDKFLDYYMLELLPANGSNEIVDKLFEEIQEVAKSIPKEGLKLSGKVFEWKVIHIDVNYFYRKLIDKSSEKHLKDMGQDIAVIPSDIREKYLAKLFPKHRLWYYDMASLKKKQAKKINLEQESWKRDVVHQALTDKNLSVQATALNVLRSIELYEKEYEVMELLFKRKSKSLRQFLIWFILQQSEALIQLFVTQLIEAKDAAQRLGALEMLTLLYAKNQMETFVNEEVEKFQQRSRISKNEEAFLSKFAVKEEENTLTHANGYGIVDYTQLQKRYEPTDKFANIDASKNIFDEYVDYDKIAEAVDDLAAIFKANENHEFQYEGWSGEVETALLSRGIEHSKRDLKGLTKEEKFKLLPLYELWEAWYTKWELNDIEMMVAYGVTVRDSYHYIKKPSQAMITRYYPKVPKMKLKIEDSWYGFNKKIHELIKEIVVTYCDREALVAFHLDIIESMMINFPTQIMHFYNYRMATDLENYFDLDERELALIERKWRVSMALFYHRLDKTGTQTSTELAMQIKKVNTDELPHTSFPIRLYREGILSQHDFFYHLLLPDTRLNYYFEEKKPNRDDSFFKISPEKLAPLTETYAQLKETFLEIELLRGDIETEVSPYVRDFSKIEGIEYFQRLLQLIGKAKLNTHIFSSMLKKTEAKKEESYEMFEASVKGLKLTKKRWLEIAMYVPQWSAWIGKLIKLEHLKDAIWWFQAHASDSYYFSDEDKSMVGRYTNISIEDFGRGALDLEWFNRIYPEIGKANWSTLTEFAKYTQGGHRLVKLYSSIILKEVKIREINQKIKTKRDKDYLRGLGLVPLSKTNPQKDLLTRYNLMQTFFKESKRFGSQRQESEKNAVQIAMDNLSRTAGYSDSIRLSLAMEAKATQAIMQEALLTFDETTIELKIDDFGKADIFVTKEGKNQKSIPAKYKKEKAVKSLQENKKYLKAQYSRIVKFLEEAMLTQEAFTQEEVEMLMQHPLVKPLLSKLVLHSEGKSGFFREGGLFDSEENTIELNENATLSIAHAVHLYHEKSWANYQRYAFEQQLVQPFKQIFRELYLPTADEKEQATYSKRYAGHQVQTQKTVALLKTRGWKVDYDEGLHKRFHKQGFTAYIYAMADWFSPADVESPTLEEVRFDSIKDYKAMKLTEVDEVIFSEVMRDVDLVVSVAHVGGVDPEASHSTLEMRAVLAKESARLFKLENVEVKERHIIIKGKLATYSVHLGSGVVSKEGLSLSIIPVHSQHRGRLFLPFIDDDPKSAEIIAKMKHLAEDDKIQDPTILEQIYR